jgi:hypothetical protein
VPHVSRGHGAYAELVTQMVLDAGKLMEFASPKELLQTKGGFLRSLVDESADKEALYEMAEGRRVET